MGLNVDTKMLPMKAHYFLYNGGKQPVDSPHDCTALQTGQPAMQQNFNMLIFTCIDIVFHSHGLGGAIHAGLCTAIRLLVVRRGQHIFGAAITRTHC